MPSLASPALGTSRTVRHITCRRRDSCSVFVLSLAFLWFFSLNIQAFSLIFSFNRSISKELIL